MRGCAINRCGEAASQMRPGTGGHKRGAQSKARAIMAIARTAAHHSLLQRQSVTWRKWWADLRLSLARASGARSKNDEAVTTPALRRLHGLVIPLQM